MRLARALKPTLLSPVVMAKEAAHDDITAAFLLTQVSPPASGGGGGRSDGERGGCGRGRPAGGVLLCGLRVPGDAGERVAVSGSRRCQAVAGLQGSGYLPVLAG